MKRREREIKYDVLKFFIPMLIGFGGAAIFLLSLPTSIAARLLPLMLAYFFPPMGKESVIPIGIASGIPPYLMIFVISFIDTSTGLFMVWNYDNIKYIPLIGEPLYSLLKKAEEKGKKLSKEHKWIKSLEFIGIAIFVMIPFQGTGAIGASIIGRIIGMNPWRVWFATIVGSVFGCSFVAYGSEIIKLLLKINPIFSIIFVFITIAVIYIFIRILKESF